MRSLLNTTLFLVMAMLCMPLYAHEGHDHAAEKVAVAPEGSYTVENRSGRYEVLIRYGHLEPGKESSFMLFLSHDANNAPVHGANIKISNRDNASQLFNVSESDSGMYIVSSTFRDKRNNTLDLNISASPGAELIRLSGIESGKEVPAETGKERSCFGYEYFLILAGTLLAGVLLGFFIRKRSAKAMSLLVVFILNVSPLNDLTAHEGHDHGAQQNKQANASAEFAVPKETQFLFHMLTEKIELRDYRPAFSVSGTIIPSSSGNAVLQSPQNASISSLHVQVGQKVSKGQLLAVLDQNIDAATQVDWLTQKNTIDAEVVAARKEYLRLKSIEDIAAKKELDEAERRYNTALANKKEFDKLYAGKGSRSLSLLAPISGVVQNFTWSIGSNIQAGQEIFTITDLNKVYIEAQVFGSDLNKFTSQEEMMLEAEGRDFRTSSLKLLSSGQTFNSSNQSQRVLFEVDNADHRFKIGEFVTVRVLGKTSVRTISVPNTAVMEMNGKALVFIKEAAEKYSVRYVQRGENNGEFSTIVAGLREGEKVIVNGSYQLKMIYQNQ